ncbi:MULTISPECIES: hypothetical protein [Cupriavidus]|jgi:hypothetical protein|uniref:hypothetical protein n=1 Tax=Cupriavidus sp. DF5525 TaxID=3160989 RepID=UPI0032DFD311
MAAFPTSIAAVATADATGTGIMVMAMGAGMVAAAAAEEVAGVLAAAEVAAGATDPRAATMAMPGGV